MIVNQQAPDAIMSRGSVVLIALSVTVLSGMPASARDFAKEPLSSEEALIKGVTSSILKNVLNPFGFLPNAEIQLLDRQKVAKGSRTALVVTPGPHGIYVSCAGVVGNVHFKGGNYLEVDAKGGHVYQIKVRLQSARECAVTIEEVSTEPAKAPAEGS